MKKSIYFIIGIGIVAGGVSANGDSLLKATSFPKTFSDLPFITRLEVLADGYKDYEPIYDKKGRCISGCAYPGITIEDETEAIARNTRLANNAVSTYIATQPTETPSTEIPTTQEPQLPAQPTSPAMSAIQQNCRPYRVVQPTDIPWNSPVINSIFISSDFGPRKAPIAGATSWHKGIDISVPTGTPVYATANGTVEYIRDQGNNGGGKYVIIKHNDSRFRTGYFHLSNNQVLKVGDTVRAGDMIGISGNSGASTGPHLDYRVFYTQPGKAFGWGQDVIDPLWTKNYMDTQYKFKSQATKSCLHNPRDFCVRESVTKQTPPETLPCEAK